MSKNTLNEGWNCALGEGAHGKISMLAFRRKWMMQCIHFEQILHQSPESPGYRKSSVRPSSAVRTESLKKFDYDSSTVRKRFFREALLQIFIPYMLKQLSPSCASELPRFQELIFEDFSSFILVENIFEEVVLHSVMKDIMMAVKEAAVQRRHNLYRDSIVLSNSDPPACIYWENTPPSTGPGSTEEPRRRCPAMVTSQRRMKRRGEKDGDGEENSDAKASLDQKGSASPKASESPPVLSDGSVLKEEEAKPEEQVKEIPLKVESATENASALKEKDKGEDSQSVLEEQQPPPSSQEGSEKVLLPGPPPKEIPSGATEMAPESPAEATPDFPPPPHDDSGFQSPTSEAAEAEEEMQVAPLPAEEHIEVKET
ncbi:niban-like protein 1, partial [Lates japonicus]